MFILTLSDIIGLTIVGLFVILIGINYLIAKYENWKGRK